MRIPCEIEHGTTEGNYQRSDGSYYEVPCTYATCSRCGYWTESYGDHEGSITRCLVLMREECPRDEENFYVDEDAG